MAANYSLLVDTEPLMDDVDFPDPEPPTFSTRGQGRESPPGGDPSTSHGNHGNGNHGNGNHGNGNHGNGNHGNGSNVRYTNGDDDDGVSPLAESHRTMVGVNRDYASEVLITVHRQSSVPSYYASRETEENVKCIVSSILFFGIVIAVIIYMFLLNPEM